MREPTSANSAQRQGLAAAESLTAVSRLLNETAALSELTRSRSRRTAPHFNVFRLLGIEHSEVGLHSRLLGELLDPFGMHGQGGLFLRGFMKLLERHDPRLPDLVDDMPRRGVWQIGLERSNVDISIRSRQHGVLIFVENKVWAGEQDSQLTRYRRLLEATSGPYATRLLIAIAPRCYPDFTTGKLDEKLEYESHIREWLEEALHSIEAPQLRSTIEQYLAVVSTISGGL